MPLAFCTLREKFVSGVRSSRGKKKLRQGGEEEAASGRERRRSCVKSSRGKKKLRQGGEGKKKPHAAAAGGFSYCL